MSELPAGHEFVPLAALERQQRNARARERSNVQTFGAGPLGQNDGGIEPTAWEGQPIPARQWIVDDLIPCGEVTMVTGNGGEGKSLLTLQLLIAAATGVKWLGRGVKQYRSIGIYCEDDRDELMRRTSGVLFPQRLGFADLDGMYLFSRKGKDSILFQADRYEAVGSVTNFFHRLRATILDYGAQIIVLDSLYNFYGGNENDRLQPNQFVNALAEIAQEVSGAVILVAHPSRTGIATGSGDAGSTSWHNAVRSRLYLHRKKHPSGDPDRRGPLVLSPMKGNYAPPQDEIELMWEEGRFVPVIEPDAVRYARQPYGDQETML
jgi:RecA-family ATPase